MVTRRHRSGKRDKRDQCLFAVESLASRNIALSPDITVCFVSANRPQPGQQASAGRRRSLELERRAVLAIQSAASPDCRSA